MFYFILKDDKIKYPINLYGRQTSLWNQYQSNYNDQLKYINRGNLILNNQNVLVQFLLMMDIDPEWDKEYLINVIASKYNRIASTLNLTCLYSKGKSFTQTVFPEKDHQTLLYVPFGISVEENKKWFECSLNDVQCFKTLYTTDNKQHWNISAMTPGELSTARNGTYPHYSVIEINPFALCIGYYRYLRERIEEDRIVGLSPHAYLLKFPFANFYMRHNYIVNLNYLNSPLTDIVLDPPHFAMIDYNRLLKEYIAFQHGILLSGRIKTYQHFIEQVSQLSHTVSKDLFVNPYNSGSFSQLNWVFNFGSLGLLKKYLGYRELTGYQDKSVDALLKTFFLTKLNVHTNRIPDPLWKKHFEGLYEEVKQLI